MNWEKEMADILTPDESHYREWERSEWEENLKRLGNSWGTGTKEIQRRAIAFMIIHASEATCQ
jgi:hypothetical protein